METENETLVTMDTADDESFVIMDMEQTETIALTLIPKNNAVGVDSTCSTTQICATMKARKLPEGADRTPVDIIVALDVSGSMRGDKLNLCKQTLELLLRHLLPQDRFGLITFSSDASVVVPLQLMTNEKKEETLTKIKLLRATYTTNISAAIGLSFQELRTVGTPNKVRSVFLLTDGHANQGIMNQAGLVELTRNCWKEASHKSLEEYEGQKPYRFVGSFLSGKPSSHDTKVPATTEDMPISMFCFGYGSDHNAAILRDIASATETGSYYYVKDDSDVGSAFGDAMGGILSVVAQSAVLTVQVPPESRGVEIKKVHDERAIQRDNGTYTVNIGDFYAEESRDVIIEVTLANVNTTGITQLPHLSASLAYTDILQKKPVQSKPLICTVNRPPGSEVSEDNAHVAAQWLRVVASREMKNAEQFAQQNDLVQGRQCLQRAICHIDAAPSNIQRDFMIRELKNDLETVDNGFQSLGSYEASGAMHVAQKRQTWSVQRCSETLASAPNVFRSPGKRSMATKFTLPKK
jgi:von Willebrand factor type A domain